MKLLVPPATLIMAIVLIAVFVFESITGAARNDAALIALGALATGRSSPSEWWRLLTFAFLHFDLRHIVTNSIALVWVGSIVERRVGAIWWLAVYAAAVLASGIAVMYSLEHRPSPDSAVGASGAIFGLVAAALVLVYRPRADDRDRKLRRPLIIFTAIAAAVSLLPHVSMAGHVGGFVGGGAMMLCRANRRTV